MKVFMNPMTYMMQIITRQRWSGLWLGGLLVISAGLVSGCSGGGSSSSSTPPVSTTPPASTVGTFVDSPVDGLHYTSPPSNPAGGVTRGGGHFQCQADDHVTFDLVGRVIGIPQPCSSNPVTAVSVFGATSATDPKVVNLSRLLLTLGCPLVDNCNVIQLPATLPALPGTLDFSLPTTTFATNIQAAGGLTLVPEATATTHLQASFKMLSVAVVNSGTVTSVPAGINCSAGTCSVPFLTGTEVTLTATGTGFTGWSGGGCSGTGTCVVSLNQDITVTATLTTVAGVAAAYFIRGGTVNAYEVDNGGTVSTTSIGTAATGAEGSFSVTLSKTPTGAIQLVVTGGSYTSEADQTKTVTNGSLSVLLPTVPASGLSNVSIHPLTSMATSQALTALKTGASSDVARAVATANTAIKSLYGLTADPNTIRPDYTKAAVTTNPDAARLALILGAIEQLVINLNVTPSALYGALVSDFADGKLDGKNATGAVPLESGTLAPPTGTANFLIALTAYEAHPSGTQLSSNGIAAADLSSIDAGLRQTMVAAVPTGAVVLTVTTAGTGTGTVTSAPAGITCGMACMAAFSSGTTVTLSANANAVSTFVGWSRGGCAVGNGAVTPTATTTIQATFAASVGGGTVPLTVTTAGTGTGTVTSAPAGITCGTICAENFPLGTTVTLTANPDASSTFVGWSGSGCAGIGLCTVTPTAATTVQATFTTTTPGAGPAGASVTLAWGSVNDPSVQGYRVYYGTASLNYQPPFDAGLNTTFTISNLQSGTGYYFAVTAYNSAGQSGYSDEVSVTCPL